jgi:hypothetical protein
MLIQFVLALIAYSQVTYWFCRVCVYIMEQVIKIVKFILRQVFFVVKISAFASVTLVHSFSSALSIASFGLLSGLHVAARKMSKIVPSCVAMVVAFIIRQVHTVTKFFYLAIARVISCILSSFCFCVSAVTGFLGGLLKVVRL